MATEIEKLEELRHALCDSLLYDPLLIDSNFWLIKNGKSGRDALRTKPLAGGSVANSYYCVLLRIRESANSIEPFLLLNIRGNSGITNNLSLRVEEDTDSRELIEIESTRIESVEDIVHNGYSSLIWYSIPYKDLISFYLNKATIVLEYNEGRTIFQSTSAEDLLQLLSLKYDWQPSSLNNDEIICLNNKLNELLQEEEKRKQLEEKRKQLEEEERNTKAIELEKQKQEQKRIMEANKQACLKEYSAKFVNLLLTVLNNPSDSRFIDLDHGHDQTYYLLQHIDVEKAYQLIADDKELKTKYKGITVSFKMLIAFLEKKGIINIVNNEDARNPRYRLLRINVQQTLDMIDGKVKKDEVLGEKHFDKNNSSKKSSGCYIATCVYGSYDCPEVWILRRFRDQSLNRTLFGRLFIKIYYVISPKLVQWFGSTRWFRFFWRKRLDSFVKELKASGYESSPYDDNNH